MAPITPLRAEAQSLLAPLDAVLGTVRLLWLESARKSQANRKWMWRLNQLLDQRLHLMRLRDGK